MIVMYKNILFILFLLPLNLLAGSDGGFYLILTKVSPVNSNKTVLTFHNPKEEYFGNHEIYKKCSNIFLELEYTRKRYFIDRLKDRNYKEYRKHFEYLNKIQNFINKQVVLDIDLGGAIEYTDMEKCLIKSSWLEVYDNKFYPRIRKM